MTQHTLSAMDQDRMHVLQNREPSFKQLMCRAAYGVALGCMQYVRNPNSWCVDSSLTPCIGITIVAGAMAGITMGAVFDLCLTGRILGQPGTEHNPLDIIVIA